jgi:hypothetical protein
MTPMLRGAQAGQYYNGTNIIPALRLCEDFNWDTHLEWGEVGTGSGDTFDPVNGRLQMTGSSSNIGVYLNNPPVTDGWYTTKITFPNHTTNTDRLGIVFRGSEPVNDSAPSSTGTHVMLYFVPSSATLYIYQVIAGTPTTLATITPNPAIASNSIHTVSALLVGNTITVYIDGVLQGTGAYTFTGITGGYFGIVPRNSAIMTHYIHSVQINSLNPNSTNGSAVSIAGWAHGGSMGTADWAGLDFVKDTYAGSRDYSCAAKYGLSTVAGGNFSFFFEDKTLAAAILASGGSTKEQDTTTGTAYATFSTPTLRLGPANNGDEIFCGILGTMAGATPPIYLTELSLSAATQTLAASLDSISSESSRLAISQHLAASLGSTSGITARLAISQLLSASLASTTDESARLAIGQLLSCDLESTSDLYANLYLPPAIRGVLTITARKKDIAVTTLKKVLTVSEG